MPVKNPISELQSTELYRVLLSLDDEYAERISRFVAAIAPILATTERHFPLYTRHDAHHGYRVVRRIEAVIERTCLDPNAENALAPAEIFLLIAAAYAHDLGMTIFPSEEDDLLRALDVERSPGWETSVTLQAHLRREHSKRGGRFILENADELGVPLNLVHALDTMMKAHNFAIAELDALDGRFAAQEREIDVRQLAAIVCVGDALEFSDTRVMDGVFERIRSDPSEAARISYRENMKHVCVGDSLAVDPNGRIIVSGTFRDEAVLALTHQTFDDMEGWVKGYCDIDRRSKQPRLAIRPEDFLRNLVLASGRFERLGVRLNKKSVIDLIASNAVWRSNAGIAVRELIQNAVEACRYRAHHSAAADRYEPTVRVEFDRVRRTVTVTDNGCGMSERTVLNNLLTVGSSRSKEAGYREADYAPIARFGIGFWSVFTIAKQARVETAAFEPHRGFPQAASKATGISFDVSLADLKDYTVFRPVTRPVGTCVELTLHDGALFDDIIARGREMLLCSSIPVMMAFDDQEICVPQSVPDVSDAELFGSRAHALEEFGVRTFRWRGEIDDTELSFGLAYRLVDGKATFLSEPSSSLLNVLGGIRYPKTAICGFSVPLQLEALCIDLQRVGTYMANHRSPEGFEFALDRQQLLPNSATARFARNIAALFHAGYREFLATTNSRDSAMIATLRDQAQMHGGNVFDYCTGNELANAAKYHPDLLCFRLYPVSQDASFDDVTPLFANLTDLQKMKGIVCTLQKTPEIRQLGSSQSTLFNVEGPRALETVYRFVQQSVASGNIGLPVYIMEADRLGSMLFDADEQSSALFATYGILEPPFVLCVQTINLDRATPKESLPGILAHVRGRWSGTIYIRTFNAPNRKPYLFLGRGRVLVNGSSRLCEHLRELAEAGRWMRVAEVIELLHEDEAGYTPAPISELLKVAEDIVPTDQR